MLSDECRHLSLWLVHIHLWLAVMSADPLFLTPFIDKDDITTALEHSEVRDPDKIIPKSYSGFITVDKRLGNHLFFWFFPAISEPEAPVVVWLNGGPTVSSMLGLLWENGPIRIQDASTYTRWEKSWAEKFAMLYIDNPVGTGYSHSEAGDLGWRTDIHGYTNDLFSFITQFYKLFPAYLKRELYIGGQSYAGKYVPAFAFKIHTELKANKSLIPLAGIYLGGPYFDPFTQSAEQGRFFYSMGAISRAQYDAHANQVREMMRRNETGKNKNYGSLFNVLFNATSYKKDNYLTGAVPPYKTVSSLMNTMRIRQLIHVGPRLGFDTINDDLYSKFAADLLVSTKPQLAEIMNNYKVLIYSGDFDGLITVAMTEAAVLSTPWSLKEKYSQAIRRRWEIRDQISGYYTYVGKFCRVVVRNAGHQTPNDQPDATKEMMLNFVSHGCIPENGIINGQHFPPTNVGVRLQTFFSLVVAVFVVVVFK